MRSLIESMIKNAAVRAGLAFERIMFLSAADNLTLPKPRIELNFVADAYTRTGRKLAVNRDSDIQTTKTELYEVSIDVTAQVYADNAKWLANFEHDFVSAFPRGMNDTKGNYIKVLVKKANFKKEAVKRVGMIEIEIFTKLNTLFYLTFTGRISKDEEQKLITEFDIQTLTLDKKD